VVQLINSYGLDEFPKWSPDGLRITFRSGNQVHIMNADGSNNQTITNLRGFCVTYDWK
jgi:Tol biopolymer transport system component